MSPTHAPQKLLGAPVAPTRDTIAPVMCIELDEETVKDIQTAIKAGESSQISFGKSPVGTRAFHHCHTKLTAQILNISDRHIPLDISKNTSIRDIYTMTVSDRDLHYAGRISHDVIKKTEKEQDTVSAAAAAKLRAGMAAAVGKRPMETDKAMPPAKRRALTGSSAMRPNSRPDGSLAAARSRPASPAMNAPAARPCASSQLAPTSQPAVTTKATKNLIAAKKPFLHLLAIQPASLSFLSKKLCLTEAETKDLVDKYARDAREGSKKELTDRSFTILDIWGFNYPTSEDRELAQENARAAFDRMRIPATDAKQWDNLLAQLLDQPHRIIGSCWLE